MNGSGKPGAFTQFYGRYIRPHTLHMSPVLVEFLAFIVAPWLTVYIASNDMLDDKLKTGQNVTAWELKKPLLVATASALGGLGALGSNALADRRRKLMPPGERLKVLETETAFLRRGIEEEKAKPGDK